MILKINGAEREIPSEIKNVKDLLSFLGIRTRFVAVELNGKIVYKEDYKETTLKEGDKLEIASFVGGG